LFSQEAKIAKERKDRLIEEVRRHFGYTIDPRDERFKEMLELKEKEQRKALKESKRQAKETKLMSKLIETQTKPGDNKKSEEAEEKN
jgi:Growth arrest and DNA-damage-inducible proteins-interacting protein 1